MCYLFPVLLFEDVHGGKTRCQKRELFCLPHIDPNHCLDNGNMGIVSLNLVKIYCLSLKCCNVNEGALKYSFTSLSVNFKGVRGNQGLAKLFVGKETYKNLFLAFKLCRSKLTCLKGNSYYRSKHFKKGIIVSCV